MKNLAIIAVGLLVAGGLVFAVLYSDYEPGPSGPNPQVVMETSMGTVKMELFQDKAPISVKNFLQYVDTRHYDGTIFHRVIKDFMVQGGGFTPGMRKEKPTFDPIKNEGG